MSNSGLFDRLPEIYRTRDTDLSRAGQFEAYVGLMDDIFQAIDEHIDTAYEDHFIENCANWMIPYISDLLGVTHLKGDPWTIRADTARTVALRRSRGTLGAMESLAFNLTGWAAHAVELRERLVWNQHLNHQRPDAGGLPPQSLPRHLAEPVRHGTVSLRDPGVLSFLGGAFDDFARTADLKPSNGIQPRPNLPNLAIFLWRLQDYLTPVTQPFPVSINAQAEGAAFAARFIIHPLGHPVRLFNTFRYDPGAEPAEFSLPDRTPGPIPTARLQEGPPSGNAAEYVAVDIYSGTRPADPGDGAVGLTMHLPANVFAGTEWTTRGANLCAWESGLRTPVQPREIVIDPVRGRLLFGIEDDAIEGEALRENLRTSYTYAAPGPTGGHPIARTFDDTFWPDLAEPEVIITSAHPGGTDLGTALSGLANDGPPRIIEINDSMTHQLDLSTIFDISEEDGPTLTLARPFWIRASTGQRPIIELLQPLRIRSNDASDAALNAALDIRIDGVILCLQNAPANTAIITRAAVNTLQFNGVTLNPGGHRILDGTAEGSVAAPQSALNLTPDLGFTDPDALEAFEELPHVTLKRCISGPIAMGSRYTLTLTDTLVDGGNSSAIGATDPAPAYGPISEFNGVTVLGAVRIRAADGQGGLFKDAVQVRDHQTGCLSYCRFTANGNRLPPHFACVFGSQVSFTSNSHHESGYGQLNPIRTDREVLEDGPEADEMGAFGYQLNTHRRKNLSIRLREFTPVGVRSIIASVT